MKKRAIFRKIRVRHFLWGMIGVLVFSLIPGVVLYWQGVVNARVLISWILALVAIGFLFTFGTRVAQKDGFLDGYARAKDHFDKKKKG